jgi:hypothetical protein
MNAVRCTLLLLCVICIAATSRAAEATKDVLTYHGDTARSGNFVIPKLDPNAARGLHLDPAFRPELEGHVYAQPLYWAPGGGGPALLIVATEDDSVYALDAKTGKTVWRRSLGKPAPRSALPCGNIDPLGITGAPAIDARGEALYLDAMVLGSSGAPTHAVFGLSLRDGSILPGWPIDVAAALRTQGIDFAARNQNERGALIILGDTLYVPFGGHFGDCGSYRGRVVGLKLGGTHAISHWQTGAQAGGIWAPAGISSDGSALYVATGNTMGTRDWRDGEAVIRLPPDLKFSGESQDYFAPSDWRELDARDADLGGVAPVPIDVPADRGTAPMILTLGKDGKAYLLDRRNLGGIDGALAVRQVSPRAIRTAVAFFPLGNAMAVAFEGAGAECPTSAAGRGLTVLVITSPPAIRTAWCGAVDGRGAPIVTTTDGHSNPLVWMLGAEGDDRLYGFRGDTGEKLIESQPMKGLRHFGTLIATPERLYVAADNAVYAFAF